MSLTATLRRPPPCVCRADGDMTRLEAGRAAALADTPTSPEITVEPETS